MVSGEFLMRKMETATFVVSNFSFFFFFFLPKEIILNVSYDNQKTITIASSLFSGNSLFFFFFYNKLRITIPLAFFPLSTDSAIGTFSEVLPGCAVSSAVVSAGPQAPTTHFWL